MQSLFERMGGTYRREGEYFVPNLTLPDTGTYYFSYGQYNLGTVHAESDFTGSNFHAAGVWIKSLNTV